MPSRQYHSGIDACVELASEKLGKAFAKCGDPVVRQKRFDDQEAVMAESLDIGVRNLGKPGKLERARPYFFSNISHNLIISSV
jgi:hypothetical protein